MNEISKNLRSWKPGQSGNPKGRHLGARRKIAEAIIRDIAADWKVNGVAALAELAKTDVPRDVQSYYYLKFQALKVQKVALKRGACRRNPA